MPGGYHLYISGDGEKTVWGKIIGDHQALYVKFAWRDLSQKEDTGFGNICMLRHNTQYMCGIGYEQNPGFCFFHIMAGPNASVAKTPPLRRLCWNVVELYYGGGMAQLRVNGMLLANASNFSDPNTATVNIIEVGFEKWSINTGDREWLDKCYMAELEIDDSQWPGMGGVAPLALDADVQTGWTSSTGTTQYTLLQPIEVDDNDYIYTDKAGVETVVSCSPVSMLVKQVKAVQLFMRTALSEAGGREVRVNAHIGGASYEVGREYVVTTVPDYINMTVPPMDNNPSTGLPWQPGEIDDMGIGVDLP